MRKVGDVSKKYVASIVRVEVCEMSTWHFMQSGVAFEIQWRLWVLVTDKAQILYSKIYINNSD